MPSGASGVNGRCRPGRRTRRGGSELRYWRARRGSAEVVKPAEDESNASFGIDGHPAQTMAASKFLRLWVKRSRSHARDSVVCVAPRSSGPHARPERDGCVRQLRRRHSGQAVSVQPATSGGFLARNLLAFRASLRESDRNRLFLAFHSLAASAALERASLAALHGALDVIGRGLGISSHGVFSSEIPAKNRFPERVP